MCMMGAPSFAGELTTDLSAVVPRGYAPLDADERGLWQSWEKLEELLAVSNLRIRDPQLNAYLGEVMQRLMGDQAKDLRIYIMRNPEFNAAMAPSGVMIVNTGFLARVRNEGQLAAVLGHEAGHYLRRHTLQSWRSIRTKSAIGAFVAAGANVATGYTGQTTWYDLANAINQNLLLSVFQHSRGLESEADAYGFKLLSQAGYSPESASQVWTQLIEEHKASAAARGKRYKAGGSALSTHPPPEDRQEDLAVTAKLHRMRNAQATFEDRREAYLLAIGPHRVSLLEEQVMLNNPGASLYLLNALAQDGWDSTLRFSEGEVYRLRNEAGDPARAMTAYRQAIEAPGATSTMYRAHGYAQLKHGNREEGIAALRHYLTLEPTANDAQMVRFTLEQ